MKSFHIVKIQLMYSAQTVGRAAVAPYGAAWKEKDGWAVVDTGEKSGGKKLLATERQTLIRNTGDAARSQKGSVW